MNIQVKHGEKLLSLSIRTDNRTVSYDYLTASGARASSEESFSDIEFSLLLMLIRESNALTPISLRQIESKLSDFKLSNNTVKNVVSSLRAKFRNLFDGDHETKGFSFVQNVNRKGYYVDAIECSVDVSESIQNIERNINPIYRGVFHKVILFYSKKALSKRNLLVGMMIILMLLLVVLMGYLVAKNSIKSYIDDLHNEVQILEDHIHTITVSSHDNGSTHTMLQSVIDAFNRNYYLFNIDGKQYLYDGNQLIGNEQLVQSKVEEMQRIRFYTFDLADRSRQITIGVEIPDVTRALMSAREGEFWVDYLLTMFCFAIKPNADGILRHGADGAVGKPSIHAFDYKGFTAVLIIKKLPILVGFILSVFLAYPFCILLLAIMQYMCLSIRCKPKASVLTVQDVKKNVTNHYNVVYEKCRTVFCAEAYNFYMYANLTEKLSKYVENSNDIVFSICISYRYFSDEFYNELVKLINSNLKGIIWKLNSRTLSTLITTNPKVFSDELLGSHSFVCVFDQLSSVFKFFNDGYYSYLSSKLAYIEIDLERMSIESGLSRIEVLEQVAPYLIDIKLRVISDGFEEKEVLAYLERYSISLVYAKQAA